jgi:hypothetical protein
MTQATDKPELQQRLQTALSLPDDALHYYATDLYVLALPGVGEWLKANYKFWSNVTTFIGQAGTPWAGKRCFDIPFAGVWPK